MADPLSPEPTVTDPELETALVRLLSIRGQLGSLKVLDTVVPVVNMGDVVASAVDIRQPAYRSTDVFSAGAQTAAAINTVHADTGALPAGVYDVRYYIRAAPSTTTIFFQTQHRNAANAANLDQWDITPISATGDDILLDLAIGYELALNERLRVLNLTAMPAALSSVAVIFARIRS